MSKLEELYKELNRIRKEEPNNLGLHNEIARQIRIEENDYDELMRQALREDRIEKSKKEAQEKEAQEKKEQELQDAGYKKVTTTEYEEEWDGEGGDFIERTEWVKEKSEDAKTETYQRIHSPEPYCIDRLEVVNGKVVKGYVHALYAELKGDWSLRQYMGMTVEEIEGLGFKTGHNPDVINMCNNYQTGSTYRGLHTSHGNQNVPTQTFVAHKRKPRK